MPPWTCWQIIGESQREERLEVLDRRMEEMGLDAASYWWYRDLRRYGTVPHAGFGLGFERMIMYATGMANIRVLPYPRTPGSADFQGLEGSARRLALRRVSGPRASAPSAR